MIKKTIGLIIILTGVLLLLSNFDIVSFNDISSIVFSLSVAIIGVVGMIEKRRFDLFLGIITLIGGLYFLSNVGLFDSEIINLVVGPVIIILIGVSLFFSITKKVSNKPVTSYVAVFSGVEDKNVSTEYVSSEITAIFGGATVDYRNIKIKDKVGYINVIAIFGGAEIIVPNDVKVTVKGLPIFGGAENKTVLNENAKKELVINYTAAFGGVEIRN